jgi:uncharacterized protein
MEKHDLLHEFPEHQDKIHQLKTEDPHFRKLFDEYHEVEHQVRRINSGSEIASDEFIHGLKAKLLHLKDAIFSFIK